MTNTVHNLLLNMQKIRDISGRVFPVKPNAVRLAFERARNKAKVDDIRFHDLRHTFATRLVQMGGDIYKVKVLLGHKSITMTTRYAQHSPESLRGGVEALEKWYNSGTIKETEKFKTPQTLDNTMCAHSSTG